MSTAEQLNNEPPASEESDPILGRVLNQKFKVFSLLAAGGMGTIYRGEQLTLQRPVAIKVLSPTQVASQVDPNFHKRFFLEASILSRLQHPNIVTVFDYGKIDGMSPERYFMAMEYLQGETLFRHVRTLGSLTPPEAINIARQIARGLREAHKHDIVHRDLKPSNIMLVPGEEGQDLVKILDFGLVKVLSDDSEELTQQGAFLGSPRYMSPEQISHGKVDLRTDVYSLGVILYQMLTGKVPFESEKSVQILIAHLQTPVPRMRERNPDVEVPEPLENFVMSCLAKNPDARPSNMDAFLRALADCAHAIGLSGQFGTTGVVTMDSTAGFRAATPAGFEESSTSARRREELAGAREATPAPTTDSAVAHTLHAAAEGGTTASAPRADVTAAAAANGQGKSKTGLFAIGALVVAAGLGFVLFGGKGEDKPTPAAQGQLPVTPTAVEAALPRSFALVLQSEPPGATIKEGDTVLGRTPQRLNFTNESVKAGTRKLVLELTGYMPYSLEQGPSDKDEVTVKATLAPNAAPTAVPTAVPAAESPRTTTRVITRTKPTPSAAPPPGKENLDINSNR
jgi:hypothetical protein